MRARPLARAYVRCNNELQGNCSRSLEKYNHFNEQSKIFVRARTGLDWKKVKILTFILTITSRRTAASGSLATTATVIARITPTRHKTSTSSPHGRLAPSWRTAPAIWIAPIEAYPYNSHSRFGFHSCSCHSLYQKPLLCEASVWYPDQCGLEVPPATHLPISCSRQRRWRIRKRDTQNLCS